MEARRSLRRRGQSSHVPWMYSASPTTGDWESYIADDLVAYVDRHYRTIANRLSRGLGGHSMGGYGTIRIGMKRPDVFSSLYIMSACCLMNAPFPANGNRGAGPRGEGARAEGAGAEGARGEGARGEGQGRGRGGFGNVQAALAAAFSPNPKNPPDFFDNPTKDGELQPLVVARWAAASPLAMIDQYVTNLKKYGAIVADNGGFFSISVTPDDRWPAGCFDHFNTINITNFEVIQTTGANEGPRSAGAPSANAGSDQSVTLGAPTQLQGFVNFTGAPPVVQWKLYSGPGTVLFGNSAQTNTTATFGAPGIYTLMLSADDSVHAVAYDAVVFTVSSAISVAATRAGTNVNLVWTGGSPPFVVEKTDALSASSWSGAVTTSSQNASVPITNLNQFFRVRGQ